MTCFHLVRPWQGALLRAGLLVLAISLAGCQQVVDRLAGDLGLRAVKEAAPQAQETPAQVRADSRPPEQRAGGPADAAPRAAAAAAPATAAAPRPSSVPAKTKENPTADAVATKRAAPAVQEAPPREPVNTAPPPRVRPVPVYIED